jgi:parvulin-like peptidyl-prolyl isomerase
VPPDFIKQQEKALDPEQFREWYRRFVEAHLQRPIEEEVLLQALKTKLKPDQLKDISKQIDTAFNKEHLPAAMKQAGFQTEPEFEAALRKNGQSIDLLRTKNRNRELAMQYIGAKVMPKSGFDRPDLLKYYREHKQDYAIAAQAKWEQIHLKFSKSGGKDGTRKKAAEIVKRLEAGEDFAAIARESSNGPNASKGGARGWSTRGSLANDDLNQALFANPLNEIGDPIEGKDGIDIIRVVDRQEATYKPFSAVQEDIKAQLKNEEWMKSSRAMFDELLQNATIVKMTDDL